MVKKDVRVPNLVALLIIWWLPILRLTPRPLMPFTTTMERR